MVFTSLIQHKLWHLWGLNLAIYDSPLLGTQPSCFLPEFCTCLVFFLWASGLATSSATVGGSGDGNVRGTEILRLWVLALESKHEFCSSVRTQILGFFKKWGGRAPAFYLPSGAKRELLSREGHEL